MQVSRQAYKGGEIEKVAVLPGFIFLSPRTSVYWDYAIHRRRLPDSHAILTDAEASYEGAIRSIREKESVIRSLSVSWHDVG